ncbi:MAG: hypothetical protein HYY84_06240 [Deltaproteobacteria bacterium]|nr:hypothetical protein [Deltaproteobacteria bacterium]
MAYFSTTTLRDDYHNAIVDWQQRHFRELDLLTKNWGNAFPGQTQFQLCAKIGAQKSEVVEHGRFKGEKKFERASELRGNMFYQARGIIKAQCSTEFGSIQQHRMTLDSAISDESKYAVLRIMAEELRHAYQMFWILDSDASWKREGHTDVAKETMDELLAMETGQHVLDAFNIDFVTFLDNIVFAAVIDLVGKYQLDMQRVFSYAPVARSMGPMYSEEGFHIGSGKRILREISVSAARGAGDVSLGDVQRCLNQWVPRGLEMFGNEMGGFVNVELGFKDRTNGQAQQEYFEEVSHIVDDINASILRDRVPTLEKADAIDAARAIVAEGETRHGVKRSELLYLPARSFFRMRGPETIVFRTNDVHGQPLGAGGANLAWPEYETYLATVLPTHFLKSREYAKYRDRALLYNGGAIGSGGW